MGNRRKSRECALQLLYQLDAGVGELPQAYKDFWTSHVVDDDVRSFAEFLVNGVKEHMTEINELLSLYSANWKVSRMASIDKNILRVAIFELAHCGDIPTKVTINEAVEIAKCYGTAESGAFVNGILDNLAKKYAKEKGTTEEDI